MIIGDPIITLLDPSSQVITLPEAKDYLNVDFPLWDADIQEFIISATQSLQEFTWLLFLPSNVKVVLGQNPIKGEENYICLPFSNGAVLTSDFELIGNRIYTDEKRITVEYTAGQTEDWMKTAVKKYVADMFIHRGEEGFDSGKEAKIFCAPFISHGGFF